MPFQMNIGLEPQKSDFTRSLSQRKGRTGSGRLVLEAVNKLYFV